MNRTRFSARLRVPEISRFAFPVLAALAGVFLCLPAAQAAMMPAFGKELADGLIGDPESEYETDPTLSDPEPAPSESIPWSEIGAKAGAQYEGDGLSIAATENGAVLNSIFQRLRGERLRKDFG